MNTQGLRIAIVSNTAWNLFNFRLNLIHKLEAAGHTVVAVAPADRYADKLKSAGIAFEPVPISASGINPLSELRSVWRLRAAFKRQGVDLVLSYTPKGNLYSALACMALGVPFVPNVSGLGRAFIRRSPVTWLALGLYRLTFRRAHHVFFQNLDDMGTFLRANLVRTQQAERLPGSGVDLVRFSANSVVLDKAHDAPVFLLVARMLWDKGIGEYIAAARLVKARFPKATFRLLGGLASANPSAISTEQVDAWVKEGVVTYLGDTDDVRPYLAEADCVVLPSYREGVPRVLLEAAAMARPLIATDAPGCRDAVVDGKTGFICRPRNAEDLADKMHAFVALTGEQRHTMGHKGRAFVEQHFDEQVVLDRYHHLVTAFSGAQQSGNLIGGSFVQPRPGASGA
jgi:glycosyltransferase involved in cell wall biosynthesis